MLYQISDTTLNELCFYMISQTYPYYPIVTEFNTDLYYTGCRPNELLNTSLWTYNSPTDIQLSPLKGNSTRYFVASNLTDNLLFAIQNNTKPYQGLTLRQLQYVNKKVMPTPQVQTIDKSSVSYMYRYNYIKQLSLQGLSNAAIATRMGQSSSVIAAGYVGERLYSTTQLPPLPPVIMPVQTLADFYTDASNTATPSTVLYNYSMPANTLANNGDKVLAYFNGIADGSINVCNIQLNFGSFGRSLPTTNSGIIWSIKFFAIRAGSSEIRYSIEYCVNNQVVSILFDTVSPFAFNSIRQFQIVGVSTTANNVTAFEGYIQKVPAA